VSATQRAQVLAAMIRVVYERGVQRTTVGQVVNTAHVSRKTFYDLFADRDDCLLAAVEQATALAARRAHVAYAAHHRWVDRMRAGLFALLEFFEYEPRLASVCVVHTLQAGPATLARRRQVCDQLAKYVDDGRLVAGRQPPPLTAEAAVGGVLAVLHARLLEERRQPLTELLNPLMGFIVLPYLGRGEARAQLSKDLPTRSAPVDPIADPLAGQLRLTYRTMRVLTAIAAAPGINNARLSERADIVDEGQASKLLGRLAGLGLIEDTAKSATRNAAKAWRLTAAGKRLERSIRPGLTTTR
jgi:AcrR family transcriptional regulator/DNA-binding MarR family transcriptional regulator